MITKVINVNLHQPIYERLTAKQGDIASRYLLFHLLDGDKPFDLTNRTVRVYAIKPDKTEIFNDLTINDANKGYCTLELTSQCLASAGVVKMELYISESGKVLTSIPFELEVIPCINTANGVTSTNEFSALEVALSSLQDYNNLRMEIIQARKGHETVGKRLDNFDSQLDEKVNYNTNESVSSTRVCRFINDGSSNGYSNPQGFCTDGTNYYCAYREYNGTGTTNTVKIIKYNSVFDEVLAVTGSYGHANSLCIADSFLYVCDITDKIFKLDLSKLTLSETIQIPYGVSAISYYDGYFYLLSDNYVRKTQDFTNFTNITYTLPDNAGVSQGMEVVGDYIYMLRTSPNIILQYDLSGNLVYIFKLPLYADNVFKIGEVEDLTVIDDDIYFNAVIVDEYNRREINSVYHTNLKNNISGITYQCFMEFNKISKGFDIYVDSTNTNKNPLGTFSNPFPTLYEALAVISSNKIYNCRIYIKDTVTTLDEHVYFKGILNNVIIEALGDSCTVKNLTIGRCNATLLKIKADNIALESCTATLHIGFNSLTATSSTFRLFGGFMNTTSLIDLHASTFEGVENLNVKVNDFGCHGTFKNTVELDIGDTYTSSLVSKAKIIYVTIFNNSKLLTGQITKRGVNDIFMNNVYTGSAGVSFITFHIDKDDDNDTLIFNDVREVTLDKVANTYTTPNNNFKIIGFTFIL